MILSVALLLALAPPAHPQWAPLGPQSVSGDSWSIDRASIVRNGRRASAWFRIETPANPNWQQVQMRDEVDCDSHQYRTLEATLFRAGGGSDTAGLGEWRDAHPGSAGEREVRILCDAKGLG